MTLDQSCHREVGGGQVGQGLPSLRRRAAPREGKGAGCPDGAAAPPPPRRCPRPSLRGLVAPRPDRTTCRISPDERFQDAARPRARLTRPVLTETSDDVLGRVHRSMAGQACPNAVRGGADVSADRGDGPRRHRHRGSRGHRCPVLRGLDAQPGSGVTTDWCRGPRPPACRDPTPPHKTADRPLLPSSAGPFLEDIQGGGSVGDRRTCRGPRAHGPRRVQPGAPPVVACAARARGRRRGRVAAAVGRGSASQPGRRPRGVDPAAPLRRSAPVLGDRHPRRDRTDRIAVGRAGPRHHAGGRVRPPLGRPGDPARRRHGARCDRGPARRRGGGRHHPARRVAATQRSRCWRARACSTTPRRSWPSACRWRRWPGASRPPEPSVSSWVPPSARWWWGCSSGWPSRSSVDASPIPSPTPRCRSPPPTWRSFRQSASTRLGCWPSSSRAWCSRTARPATRSRPPASSRGRPGRRSPGSWRERSSCSSGSASGRSHHRSRRPPARSRCPSSSSLGSSW